MSRDARMSRGGAERLGAELLSPQRPGGAAQTAEWASSLRSPSLGRVATPSLPPRLCQVDRQGAPYHLLWVLHRARMLLDVYLETEGVGGGATAAVCGTLCNRRVRGRDRRKPFHFSKTTSQFDQAI